MATPKPKDNKTSNVKRYIGVATCRIAGINVKNEEFKAITGHERKKPLSIIETSDKNPGFIRANIEVLLQTIPDRCNGISATFIKRIGINNTLLSSSKGKVCMIDQYGRTAWLTPEEAKQTSVPFLVGENANGKYVRRIEPSSMRQAYGGEEITMNFIRAIYGAFDVSKMEEDATGKKVYKGNLISNPEPSRIENIQAMFQGDFREFNAAFDAVKDNWVKIVVGVGESENGLIHVIYDYFMRPLEGTGNVKYKINGDNKDDFAYAKWDFETLHEFDPKAFSTATSQSASTPAQPEPTMNPEPDSDLPF